jgi:hypothetical protein
MAEEQISSDKIAENAAAPAKATGDSGSLEQHPLPDQIAADRYAQSKAALRARPLGLRYVKLRPGGNHDTDFGS